MFEQDLYIEIKFYQVTQNYITYRLELCAIIILFFIQIYQKSIFKVITKASGIIKDNYGPDVTHVLCLHQQSQIFKKVC